jgi:hypothetical protein
MRQHALKYPFGGNHHLMVSVLERSRPCIVSIVPNVVGLPGGQRSRFYQREIGAGRVAHQNAWPAGFPASGEHQCELQQDFDNLLDYFD